MRENRRASTLLLVLGMATEGGAVLLAAPAAVAIERTSEVLFDGFERIDKRLGVLEEESVAQDASAEQARRQADAATSRIREALQHRDYVAVEEARADLAHALAGELVSRKRKVDLAREVYSTNRRELSGILTRLRTGAAGRGDDGGASRSATIENGRRFGGVAKSILLYFSHLDPSAQSPRMRSRIAAATGSLAALGQSLALLEARQASTQPGDRRRIVRTVESYVDALDSALAQLAVARRFLNEQESKLRTALRLGGLRLLNLRVRGTLLQARRANTLLEGVVLDVERMDSEAERYLYPEVHEARGGHRDPAPELEDVRF